MSRETDFLARVKSRLDRHLQKHPADPDLPSYAASKHPIPVDPGDLQLLIQLAEQALGVAPDLRERNRCIRLVKAYQTTIAKGDMVFLQHARAVVDEILRMITESPSDESVET